MFVTDSETIPKTIVPRLSPKRKSVIIPVVALVLVIAAILIYRQTSASSEVVFLTAPVVRGSITNTIQATGTIEPVQRAELQFKNSGDVKSITLQPGDRVVEGQVLAEQDDTSLLAQVRQSELSVFQQQIQIQNLTMKKEKAQKNLAEQQQLFNGGFVSQADLDEARDGFNQAELDLSSAAAQLESLQAKLEMARTELLSTRLMAPFSGIISSVDSQAGLSGGSSNSSLITLISAELQLKALVNEVDVGRIASGQAVEFTSGAYSGRTFTGKVEKISPEATTVSNVNFYPVLIAADNSEGLLRSGMSVNAKIIVAASSDVLTIPMLAVSYAQTDLKNGPAGGNQGSAKEGKQDGQSSASNPSGSKRVLVLENNQAVPRLIQAGLDDSQNIVVIEGLKEGEKVIIGSSAGSSASDSNAAGSTQTQTRDNNNRNPSMGTPIMMPR